ncbi:MAG TPA: glycosyltransferase family 39 protein, partial [Solirubrobacteraceae bacterium]|nr:glycosyltransferase family 39 protein [Solirubrobacteraceae bacterium]
MTAGEYLAGGVPALATIAACLLAAELVRRRRLEHLAGAPAALAFAVAATAALTAVQLVPGALGLLSPVGALVAAAVLVAGAWRLPPVRAAGPAQPSPPGPPSRRLSWAIAIVTAALVGGGILGFVFYESARVVGAIDVLSFHVPGMVAALQEGSLWGVHQYLPRLAHTNYPQNGDLLYLHALAPFGDLTFVRHVFVPWLGLTGLATYALARELAAPSAAATLAGVAIVALPATAIPAADAGMPDAVMLFGFAAGVLFGLRHARAGRTSDLVVAGVALGLSLGTKWYALTSVAAVVVVWLLARALARHPRGALAREGALVGGLIALAGGFWLLRNWVLTGNPLFPVRVEVLGLTIFDAPPDRVRALAGFTIADYLGAPDVLGRFVVPGWNATLGGLWLVLGVGALAAAVPAARLLRGRGGPDAAQRSQGARVLALAVLAVLLGVAYALTPYSALGPPGAPVQVAVNARYVVPALLVAAAVVAWGLGRLGRARVVAEALLAVVVVVAGARAFPPGPTSFAAALVLVGGAVAAPRAARGGRARA